MSAFNAIAAIAAVVGTGYSVHQGEQAKNRQQQAQRKALADAQRQESQAAQDRNKANRKKPNTAALLGNNDQGTLLKGSGGVSPNSLALGRNQLLGR